MGHRWTVNDYERLTGIRLPPLEGEPAVGSHRVGGRHVQRGTSGKRQSLNGLYVRSRSEANYLLYLNYMGIRWKYEPKTFVFSGVRSGPNMTYTPDVLLTETGIWHEIKGFMDKNSQVKLKRMAKQYPQERIVVIRQDFFRGICRQRGCLLIPGWECIHTGYGS